MKKVVKNSCFTKGFTLIELLVVVLIIGILAAVALPQYQKAVEKAKAEQALIFLNAVWKACETYYLEHGEWPSKFKNLDIEVAAEWKGKVRWYTSGNTDVRSNGDFSIQLVEQHGWFEVMAGRISGPYAGAGFDIAGSLPDEQIQGGRKLRTINCIENTGQYGIKFNANEGDYCQKIFGSGPNLKIGKSLNVFVLP